MSDLKRSTALKQLLIFSLPIIFGHIGLMLIGTGDMLIAGRFSREALAAIGLAISIANPIMMLGLGLLFAVSPLLAQKRGKGEDITDYFWTVIVYGVVIGIICSALTALSVYLLPFLGYTENLNRLIKEYLLISSASTLGICLYQAVKEFYQCQEKTIAPNLLALVAVAVNIFFNYAFVFGKFNFPHLEEAGLAWASLLVRSFMGFTLLFLAYKFWRSSRKMHMEFFREVFKLGWPITISIFFEVMAFCSVTLFVGRFEEVQTAANNIALNIGSLAFMLPMSIASAVGVKVGHSLGEGNVHKIKIFAQVSLITSVCFTLMMASTFALFPDPVLSLYSQDAGVMAWGRTLLFWVACFQLFDGAQVTLAGILRGLSVTRATSIAIFIGYWIIGLPLGYFLGFHRGMEAQGFWIGLALSLALVAIMLGFILKKKMKALVEQGL